MTHIKNIIFWLTTIILIIVVIGIILTQSTGIRLLPVTTDNVGNNFPKNSVIIMQEFRDSTTPLEGFIAYKASKEKIRIGEFTPTLTQSLVVRELVNGEELFINISPDDIVGIVKNTIPNIGPMVLYFSTLIGKLSAVALAFSLYLLAYYLDNKASY